MYKSLMSMVIEEKCIQSYKLVLHRNDWMQNSVFSFHPFGENMHFLPMFVVYSSGYVEG